MNKIKYFFKDIFKNGNNIQKVLLLLFVINLFTPVFFTFYDFFKGGGRRSGDYLFYLGSFKGLMWIEFLFFMFISFVLIFSMILFKSKKT